MDFRDVFTWVLLTLANCYADELKKEFSVTPGGRKYSVSLSRDDIKCTFTYACQGGTNENWQMTFLKIRGDSNYGCRVERAGEGRSYLFFQSFELSIEPPHQLLTGTAWDNTKRLLPVEEYKVNRESGVVHHMEGKFQSELNGVSLEFLKPAHEEM
ncbi:unnamed protein product [Calicophoron daubneyi]|uniref:Myeloid-derived growth factor n=1 Tax=Calicophoron daubneyi TaxID=300641 RepID=A0AAV2TYP5_CALDB